MPNFPTTPPWYLFEIQVSTLLQYLERKTGRPFPDSPDSFPEAGKWHLALRKGLHSHLHLNLGIPGLESPDHPIEENASALHAALLLGKTQITVILSGEWEIALAEGLIDQQQLERKEAALANIVARNDEPSRIVQNCFQT